MSHEPGPRLQCPKIGAFIHKKRLHLSHPHGGRRAGTQGHANGPEGPSLFLIRQDGHAHSRNGQRLAAADLLKIGVSSLGGFQDESKQQFTAFDAAAVRPHKKVLHRHGSFPVFPRQ